MSNMSKPKPSLTWTSGDGTKLVYTDMEQDVEVDNMQVVGEEEMVVEELVDADNDYVVYIMEDEDVKGKVENVEMVESTMVPEDSKEIVFMGEDELSKFISERGVTNLSDIKPIQIKQEPDCDSSCLTEVKQMIRSERRGSRRTVVAYGETNAQHRQQCLRCLRVFLHETTMQKHALSHSKDNKNTFRCMICYTSFASPEEVQHHTKLHKTDRKYSCKICKKNFSVAMHLKYHYRSAHTVGLSCIYCFKHFDNASLRQRHRIFCRVNTKQRYCHICGSKSKTSGTLKSHIRKTHLGIIKSAKTTGPTMKFEKTDESGNSVLQVTIADGDENFLSQLGNDVQIIELPSNSMSEYVNDVGGIKWQRIGDAMSENEVAFFENGVGQTLQRHELAELETPSVFSCAACDFVCKDISKIRNHVVVHSALQDNGKGVVHLCKHCGRTYLDLTEYNAHMSKHQLAQRFQCHYCNKRFENSSKLREHMAIHNIAGQRRCMICFKMFPSDKSLQQHMLVHEEASEYCCEVCGKSFKKKYSFDVHMMRHGVTPMPYQCPLCDKGFVTARHLNIHAQKVHEQGDVTADPYNCHTCGEGFSSMSEVLSHASSHNSDVKKFKCNQCPRSFTSKQALVTHLNKHDACQFQCERCCKLFPTNDRLMIHIKKCLSRDLSHKVSRPHKCHECPRSFCSSQGLYKHRRYYHNVAATTRRGRKPLNRSPTHNKPYTCTHCATTVIGETEFRSHMEQHVARVMYVCGTCDEQFTSEARLKFHMAAHSGCLLYKCGVCRSAAFSTAAKLKEHIDKHGERGARYCCECGFCGKLCTYVSLLIKHIKMHTDEKEYKCEECGKMLRNITTYRTHMMRHQGNYRFSCSMCPKRFLFRGDLEKHLEKHQDSKPYKCDQCNKVYTTKYSLFEHKRSHTGIYPYICNTCGKGFSFPSHYEYHIRKHVLDQTVDQLIPPPPHVVEANKRLKEVASTITTG